MQRVCLRDGTGAARMLAHRDRRTTNIMSEVILRIDHTMLPVANLDASITFYTQALGMRIVSTRRDDDAGVRAAHVGYGERGLVATIELTERRDSGPIVSRPISAGHIALQVSDLSTLETQLHNHGLHFTTPPAPSGGIRIAWITDPDGHPVELIERA
jgi:lactoylglutathione lyase